MAPSRSAVYLTACVSGRGTELLARLRERLLQYGAVLCPLLGDDAVAGCAQRQSMIDSSAAVVADMAAADASVGAEVFYALHQRRAPTLCLVPSGDPTPPMFDDNKNPLLHVAKYCDAAEADAAIDAFLKPPEQPGRLFVIDGGDGAGKQTQTAALIARLRDEGYPVSTLDFPHDAALHGKLIRRLLSGEMGDIKAVNPLLFASLYAQNRHDVAPVLHHWLARGHNVILDRYVEANFGHQVPPHPPHRTRATNATHTDRAAGVQAGAGRSPRTHRRAHALRARLARPPPRAPRHLPRPTSERCGARARR